MGVVAECFASATSTAGELEGRMRTAETRAEQLRAEAMELESIPTRRVDFVIQQASMLLCSAEDRSWLSPPFGAGGCMDLELELRLLQDDPSGDCQLLLRGRGGTHARIRMYLGAAVSELVYSFDGHRGAPCAMHAARLQDAIDPSSDTLRLGVEVLEGYATLETSSLALRPGSWGSSLGGGFDGTAPIGSLCFHRYVCPAALDRVQMVATEIERLRSRIAGRVEWRIEQAALLPRCFERGSSLCSAVFAAGGLSDLQLVFYPSGDKDARDLYCSFYLHAPDPESLHCWLSVGKNRREALSTRERPHMFGRSNFCLFEGSVDRSSDVLTLSLEIAEAQQSAPPVKVMPWPALSPSPTSLDGEPSREERPASQMTYKESVRSSSKLQGTPGRLSVDDVIHLPPIWSPSLSKRSGDAEVAKPGLSMRSPQPGTPQGFRSLYDLPPEVARTPPGSLLFCADTRRVASPGRQTPRRQPTPQIPSPTLPRGGRSEQASPALGPPSRRGRNLSQASSKEASTAAVH